MQSPAEMQSGIRLPSRAGQAQSNLTLVPPPDRIHFFNPVTVTYVEELEARFLRMLDLKELIGDEADGNPEALKQAKRELREIRQSMRLEHGRLQAEFRPYLELPASYLTLPSTRAATMKW
jgi:hypothetical protein